MGYHGGTRVSTLFNFRLACTTRWRDGGWVFGTDAFLNSADYVSYCPCWTDLIHLPFRSARSGISKMWDGLWMVLLLGGIMALASFLAGSLPLFFSLSQRQMRLISTLGTGLLVGTALIVIIPEGISTMYSASASSSLSSVAKSQMVAAAEQEPEKGPLAILANHGVGPHQQQNEEAGRAEELAHLGQRGVSAMVGALAKRAAEAAAAPAKEEHGHG